MKKVILLLVLVLGSINCSTQLKIQSEPSQAVVYFVDQKSGEKKKLGETPIDKKNEEISKLWGDVGFAGELAELVFEKQGFATKSIMVPVSASGSITTEINVKLKEGESAEFKTAQNIIDQLFLAQEFARTKQYERALIEIDKLLIAYPKFSRALSMKGSIYFAKGESKESLTWFDKALEANPENKIALEMSAKVRQNLRLPAATKPTSLPGR